MVGVSGWWWLLAVGGGCEMISEWHLFSEVANGIFVSEGEEVVNVVVGVVVLGVIHQVGAIPLVNRRMDGWMDGWVNEWMDR